MPRKRVCLLAFIVLQIFIGWAISTKSFAQPIWCPDLTNDNFVNFFDFAIQAENWLQSGSSLPGDFDNSGIVDINDFDYLAIWWLRECNNPPCTDCIYPDCNLMDCNTPPSVYCPYCETTPPFIKVIITGNHGCGCTYDEYPGAEGSIYCDPCNSSDGNYIVPFNSSCRWMAIYDKSCEVYGYYPGLPPCDPLNMTPGSPDYADSILIQVNKYNDGRIHLEATWLKNGQQFAWCPAFYATVDSIGCIEATADNAVLCPEPYDYLCETAGGSAVISSGWTTQTETISPEILSSEQKKLIQLQEIMLSWLKE